MSHQDVDVKGTKKGWHLYTNKSQCICSEGASPPGYSLINTYVNHQSCSAGLVIYCANKLNIKRGSGMMKKKGLVKNMMMGRLNAPSMMNRMLAGKSMMGMKLDSAKMMMGKQGTQSMMKPMKPQKAQVTWHLVKGMDGNCHCINTSPDSKKIVLGSFQRESNCKDHIATDC